MEQFIIWAMDWYIVKQQELKWNDMTYYNNMAVFAKVVFH